MTVVDDCTLQITNFNYDGQGPTVFFYLGVASNYNPGTGILVGNQLNGRAYNNEMLTVTLPDTINIDDFDGISVWCNLFNIDFGSAPI